MAGRNHDLLRASNGIAERCRGERWDRSVPACPDQEVRPERDPSRPRQWLDERELLARREIVPERSDPWVRGVLENPIRVPSPEHRHDRVDVLQRGHRNGTRGSQAQPDQADATGLELVAHEASRHSPDANAVLQEPCDATRSAETANRLTRRDDRNRREASVGQSTCDVGRNPRRTIHVREEDDGRSSALVNEYVESEIAPPDPPPLCARRKRPGPHPPADSAARSTRSSGPGSSCARSGSSGSRRRPSGGLGCGTQATTREPSTAPRPNRPQRANPAIQLRRCRRNARSAKRSTLAAMATAMHVSAEARARPMPRVLGSP